MYLVRLNLILSYNAGKMIRKKVLIGIETHKEGHFSQRRKGVGLNRGISCLFGRNG